jgi:formylglycine-generating enzyme required for sulfatase activity
MRHPNWPVTGVSWYDAQAYCAWEGARLPAEAEWERAAAGLEGRKYPWGNDPQNEKRANFAFNVGSPTPVGLYPAGATPEGIVDMTGNVWEWIEDEYQHSSDRVLRGGSFTYSSWNRRFLTRDCSAPGNRDNWTGFRCARDPLALIIS